MQRQNGTQAVGQFKLHDEVIVEGYGAAVVTGLDCSGYEGLVQVTYTADGSMYHCKPGQLRKVIPARRETKLTNLQDPDLSCEDSLPLLAAAGTACSSADASTRVLEETLSTVPQAAAAVQAADNVEALGTSGILLDELQCWGTIVAELQRRQEPGSAPANAIAGYGELRLQACAACIVKSAHEREDPRPESETLLPVLQSAVLQCTSSDGTGDISGEKLQGQGPGRRALLSGLIERPLCAMPATEGQRSAVRSALFGSAPGLLVLENLRTAAEPAVPERSAAAEGRSAVDTVAGPAVEDSLWEDMPISGLTNSLQHLLEGPAVSASLSNPAMLDAFLSSASRVRELLARQKPSLGPHKPEGRELQTNALLPYLEAASKALKLREADGSQQATLCLDVALLAAVHSGELRPCLEWLDFLTSGELGGNISLGPLTGLRRLAMAARMCPVQFNLMQQPQPQDASGCCSFLSSAIPAAGVLGLALRLEVPETGVFLQLLKSSDMLDTCVEQPSTGDGHAEKKQTRKHRKRGRGDEEAQTGPEASLLADSCQQSSAQPFVSVRASGGIAVIQPGGSEVRAVSRLLIAEFLLDFNNSQVHVFVNGRPAGKFPLPAADVSIMVTCQALGTAQSESSMMDLQRWPIALPLPESQHLANLLVPEGDVVGTSTELASLVASHLRTLNLWNLHDGSCAEGGQTYKVLQPVEVRDLLTDTWKSATVVCRSSARTDLKVKLQPQDTARSWQEVRPWQPHLFPQAGDTDRLVHLAHACLRLLTQAGDGSSAAPLTYHIVRLLRVALHVESAGASAQVVKLVCRLLMWAQDDPADGVRALIASAALRILGPVCPALATQAFQDVVDLLQAAVALAPAVPAELWLLRLRLLQSCPLCLLISQLHLAGQWPALLRKLGSAAVRPGALSLCGLLLRASLTNANGSAATAQADDGSDADVHGLVAFLDHSAAAIINGVVTAREPGVKEDLPSCLLLAMKNPVLAPKVASRAVALVGAVAKAGAPAEVVLSLVQAACELCVNSIPEREAAAPSPQVLCSLRCLPETARESMAWSSPSSLAMPHKDISGEGLLREWLSDGKVSATPKDPEADVSRLAAEVPGVLGARTRAVEVAVLRLLRCAADSSEQPDLAASQEAEQVRAAARRFLSEQQATAPCERERVVADMGETSLWLAAHWVAQSNYAVQGPVKLLRTRSALAGPSLQRSISNSLPLSPMSLRRPKLTRGNSNLMRSNSNLSRTNSNTTCPGTPSSPLKKYVKSRSLQEADLCNILTKDSDFASTSLRLRWAAGASEATHSGTGALVELLFAPGQGVAKLHDAVAVTQKRWLRWIQVATLLEQLLEVFTRDDSLQRIRSAPVGDVASSAPVGHGAASQGRQPIAPMARLQICETIALLFGAWGSPAWFEEMPKPVAQSLLGSARRVLGAALTHKPPQTVAAFGQLPLVAAAAVLGVATPSPRALLSLACGDDAESCADEVSTCLREAAWAAYLAAALLGPRAEAVSQVQAAIRPLCDVLNGGETKSGDKSLDVSNQDGVEGVEQVVGLHSYYQNGDNEDSYRCQVKSIKILKKSPVNQLQINIEAHGDMSLGNLQPPSSSTVFTKSDPPTGFTYEYFLLHQHTNDGSAELIVGTLTYSFPLFHQNIEGINFYYGSSGYSGVAIPLTNPKSLPEDIKLPSLATGKRPSSPDAALAELLVLLRRLLDAAPAGSPPMPLDLPEQLLQRPALRALTLTVLASAVRGGVAPPPHVDVALVPLKSGSAWEQLAAQQLVRIWQELLIKANTTDETKSTDDLRSWRGSAAALVARLEWRRPELAVAALAVLGCQREESPLRAATKADGWQPPQALQWVEPLAEEAPETIRHLAPEERAALFRACVQLLEHVGKAVRPINNAGMPTKPIVGPGLFSYGLRCSLVGCQYTNPCSACVAASQKAGIEIKGMPDIVPGMPLNCSLASECPGWHTDGILANLQTQGPQQLVSRELADSGVLQWTIRFDPEDLPVEVGVVPEDMKQTSDYLWSRNASGVRSTSAEAHPSKRRENFQGGFVQVRCDIGKKIVSWRKSADGTDSTMMEFFNAPLPADCLNKKVRLCISCNLRSEAGLALVYLVSKPGYGAPDVCCKNGHVLTPLGTTQDNGWRCDGTGNPGGCKRGLPAGFGATRGVPRFRCGACDFDYCNACHSAMAEELAVAQKCDTAPAVASSSQELLSVSKIQLSEDLWNHAAGVATWLLRDLPHSNASSDVKQICSETLADWLAIAANAALAEANDGDGKNMSDSSAAASISAADLHEFCGFLVQAPSNSTWAAWRCAMSEAVSSNVLVSKPEVSAIPAVASSTGSTICIKCKSMCINSGADDYSICCASCGRQGAHFKCPTCVKSGICKECSTWPETKKMSVFTSILKKLGAGAVADMGELGLVARMPPPLLTEVCVQCPAQLSSALAAGTAWPLLRHAIKHGSAARGDDDLPWAKLVGEAVSGTALEAECLSDLLGALLAAVRPVEWPKGSGLGPDLRSARWMLEAMLRDQSFLPSGRIWIGVLRALQSVPSATFDAMYGGLDTRLGICQALARAPLGALAAAEMNIIMDEAFQLLNLLADENTPGSAACLSNVAAALLALMSHQGKISAFAKPRPVAIVNALAFCHARRCLDDREAEERDAQTSSLLEPHSMLQRFGAADPILPLPLLRRFLQLPCQEETLELQLSPNEPVQLQVPTAADFELFSAKDVSSSSEGLRLAAVATATQERGNAVLREVQLSSELQSLGRFVGRDANLGIIDSVRSKPTPSSEQDKVEAAPQPTPIVQISRRDAFGRPLEFQETVSAPVQQTNAPGNLMNRTQNLEGLKMNQIQDPSFEEFRWSHYKTLQPQDSEEEKVKTLSIDDAFRWVSISEAIPDGWRVATRSDIGRLPRIAEKALAAGPEHVPCRLQSPWVADLAGQPVALTWRRADKENDEWDLLEGHLLAKVAAFNDSCFMPVREASMTSEATPCAAESAACPSASELPEEDESRAFLDVPVRSGLSTAEVGRQLPEGVPTMALGTLEAAPAGAHSRSQTPENQEETSNAAKELGSLSVLNGALCFTGRGHTFSVDSNTTAVVAGFPNCRLERGCWHYEVEMLETSDKEFPTQIGWMSSAADQLLNVGQDANSWGVSAKHTRKESAVNLVLKEELQAGTVVGVAVNMNTKQMWFAFNGKWTALPDFSAFKIAEPDADASKPGPWEVETDAGWRSFRPGVFFKGRENETFEFKQRGQKYSATFHTETTGTQRNTSTRKERKLRRRPAKIEEGAQGFIFPAVSGKAKCVFNTKEADIKYPPKLTLGENFRPIDQCGQPAASKAVGLCYKNESPALPFRFEVEVSQLPEEGGSAAVGVAWGTWSRAVPAQAASSSSPSGLSGASAAAASIFGATSSGDSSSGFFNFGPTNSTFGNPSSGSLFPPRAAGDTFPPAKAAPPARGLFEAAPPASGLFEAAPPASGLFAGQQPASSSIFGGGTHSSTATVPSLFGGGAALAATATTGGGLFGGNATQMFGAASSSTGLGLFAAAPAAESTGSVSIFGSAASTSSSSIFGNAASTGSTNIFGAATSTGSESLFGTGASTTSSSIFGTAASTGSSIFGAGASSSSSSIFGTAPSTQNTPGLFGSSLFASGDTSSTTSNAPPTLFGSSSSSSEPSSQSSPGPVTPGGAESSTPAAANAESADARWWKQGSISWLWHSDGRLECAGAPWKSDAGICASDTGQKYAVGDLVAVEFLPSVPALLFCKNGAAAFALHLVDGYGGEAVLEELHCLRNASPDVSFPIPGLFAGAQPAVRLSTGGTMSLGNFSIDGQDVAEVKWSSEHLDPCQRQVRMPAFAATSLEGIAVRAEGSLPPSFVESCGYGVKVNPALSSAFPERRHAVKLVVRSTPRDPTFLEKVLAAWVEAQLGGRVEAQPGGSTSSSSIPAAETDEIQPERQHRFYSKHCMICTECHSCTGYGRACVNSTRPGRKGGERCGCGLADDTHNSGCEVCGRCQLCAAKSPCIDRSSNASAPGPATQPSDPVVEAVATLQQCMQASAEVAITAVAPLFEDPVLKDSSAGERAQWRGLGSMLPQARRTERWAAAFAQPMTDAAPGPTFTARLKRRAAAGQDAASAADKAAALPVWEQLATQVVGFSQQALQNNANPFNVNFVGEESVMDTSIRRCPRCGRLLQKSDGCDSMACCMYGSDNCRGARCDHGGGCGHRFDWNQTLVLGPFQEALEAFSADFMASDLLTDCPNRRSRDGPNQDTRLPHPHPSLSLSDPQRYRTLLQGLGRMMGVAVRVQLPLRLALNPLVWSWLHAGGHVGLELRHLTESDQQTSKMVRYLQSLSSEEELAALGEDVEFTAENAAGELVQLGASGRTVLSVEDAHELGDCLERLHLVDGLEPLASVAEGVASVLPLGMLRLLLDPPTLEEAVCGATDVNLADLRVHTELVAGEENSSPTSPPDAGEENSLPSASSADASKPNSTESVLDWLFQALEGFTPSERRGFVRLISGNRRLPEHGEWRMRVRVDKPEAEGGSALPTSRECAMLLTLPRCMGASDLAQRLRVTIASSDAQMMS